MKGRVYRRHDGRSEDEDFGGRLFGTGRGELGGQEWKECLDGEDGVEEVCVEKICEIGRWNRRYRRGLVIQGRDENDGSQAEVVLLGAGDSSMGSLEVLGKALDGGASTRRLKSGQYQPEGGDQCLGG